MSLSEYLSGAARLLDETAAAGLEEPVEAAINAIAGALAARKPLLICGDGGSTADATHIAGQLVGRYRLERPDDAVNALFCAGRHNLRLMLNHLRALFALILAAILGAEHRAGPASGPMPAQT